MADETKESKDNRISAVALMAVVLVSSTIVTDYDWYFQEQEPLCGVREVEEKNKTHSGCVVDPADKTISNAKNYQVDDYFIKANYKDCIEITSAFNQERKVL